MKNIFIDEKYEKIYWIKNIHISNKKVKIAEIIKIKINVLNGVLDMDVSATFIKKDVLDLLNKKYIKFIIFIPHQPKKQNLANVKNDK